MRFREPLLYGKIVPYFFLRVECAADNGVCAVCPDDVFCGKPCGGLISGDAQKALASFDMTLPKDVLVDPQIFAVKTIDLRI